MNVIFIGQEILAVAVSENVLDFRIKEGRRTGCSIHSVKGTYTKRERCEIIKSFILFN